MVYIGVLQRLCLDTLMMTINYFQFQHIDFPWYIFGTLVGFEIVVTYVLRVQGCNDIYCYGLIIWKDVSASS